MKLTVANSSYRYLLHHHHPLGSFKTDKSGDSDDTDTDDEDDIN